MDVMVNLAAENEEMSASRLRRLRFHVEELNRRYFITWNENVSSCMCAEEACVKLGMDPQAWLICDTAMVLILQAVYPYLQTAEATYILAKFKGMVAPELLLNPEKHEWRKIAYLIKEHLDLQKKVRVCEETEQSLRELLDERYIPHGHI